MADVEVSYRVRYRADGAEREVRVDGRGVARPADAARELGLSTVRGSQVRRVRVCPERDLTVLGVEACLVVDYAGADALFLNGYNSWTDSWERTPSARMRGLARVPRAVVDKWVLDGSGDYRFTREDERLGHQHGFGYGYLRFGDEVLLVGSLSEDSGYTTLWEDFHHSTLTLEKEPPAHALAAGEKVELMSFALIEGSLDEAVERWLALAGVTARPAAPLVGFSSWYRYYQDISGERLATDLAAMRELLGGRDLGGCTPIFQIDDGHALIGDWLDTDAERFPEGLAPFARQIGDAGMLAGLWLAPFVCERESRICAEHPDWLQRDETGEAPLAGSNWSGYHALDTLNPEVRAYVREVMRTVTQEWGFKFLKLDFLFAACLLPRGGMNRGQLMADALDLLRDSVADDVSFDLCGVPLMSAFGRTEYCRIGCDVGLDWDDVPYMRLLHRERVSTKRSLHNTRGRAHLDGRAFRNDPDVFFLTCRGATSLAPTLPLAGCSSPPTTSARGTSASASPTTARWPSLSAAANR
jgi:alpha-galactosidase